MSPKAERPEQFIGQSPPPAEGLVSVGSSRELNPGPLNPEALDSSSVEVRFGNPEVDAPRLLELYTDPTTMEHLENVTPYPADEEEIKRREDEIRQTYRGNRAFTLLTAEIPSGHIIGACTVEKKTPNVAEIGKLVVDKDYRNKGAANRLIRAANAYIFSEEGLDCRFAEAFVIINVDSYHIAQDVFANVYTDEFVKGRGYLRGGERELTTRSWSNEEGRFVDRNSQPMGLTRRRYIDNFPGDRIKYFPTPRPPKAT